MSVDPGIEVRRAIALLKSSDMIMGNRDKAFDRLVKEAVGHLENARSALGVGPAPAAAQDTGLEPSIVEWLFGAADSGLQTAEAMAPEQASPSQAEVLAGALRSIREWAARLLQKPSQQAPQGGQRGISTPGGIR